MDTFRAAVARAVKDQNWYAALVTTLTLPDICGWLEAPTSGSRDRYQKWFDRFVAHRYTGRIGPSREQHVFLSGTDCYALRCAVLHEGVDSTERQRAKQALTKFHFVAPRPGLVNHCNQFNNALQLQVDIFCTDVCSGVERWEAEVLNASSEVQSRTSELLRVHSLEKGFTM